MPFDKNENLVVIANEIFNSIGFSVTDKNYIKHIHRTYSKNSPKPITVELSNKYYKDSILQIYKTKNKITARDINFNSTNNISIKDYLPGWKKSLLAKAKNKLLRSENNNNQYKYVWANHGNIYCRKTDDDELVKISSEFDLDKLVIT